MAKKTQDKYCRTCSGTGMIDKPYVPGTLDGYIRYTNEICNRCDGVGVIQGGSEQD